MNHDLSLLSNTVNVERVSGRARLERVVHKLRGTGPYESVGPIQDKNLDMMSWNPTETSCGTVCCVVGHCLIDPWFVNQGLGYEQGVPTYEEASHFEAIALFFNIGILDATYVFGPRKAQRKPSCRADCRPVALLQKALKIFGLFLAFTLFSSAFAAGLIVVLTFLTSFLSP